MIFTIFLFLAICLFSVFVILFFFEPTLPYRIFDLRTRITDASFPELLSQLTDSGLAGFDEAVPLIGGSNFYEAELLVIRNASRSIHLEAFIFHEGRIAQRFLEALVERAENGVAVRVVVDGIGSFWTRNEYFDPLRRAGGEVAWYQPLRWYNLKRLNNRTHRELIVIDSNVAFIGGAGIADHWLGGENGEIEWHDVMCRITGPIVKLLESTFAENWLESSGTILADAEMRLPIADASIRKGIVIRSTPSAARSTRTRILFQVLIAGAEESIRINSPYFLPDKSVRAEIIKAVRERGVKVQIITPGVLSNHPTVRRLSRAHYGELLGAGIELYEYQPSMIHTKCMIVDGRWSVLGSTNFDSRSFGLNDEVNFATNDLSLAQTLESGFVHIRSQSRSITIEEWHNRTYIERALAFADRLLERQE